MTRANGCWLASTLCPYAWAQEPTHRPRPPGAEPFYSKKTTRGPAASILDCMLESKSSTRQARVRGTAADGGKGREHGEITVTDHRQGIRFADASNMQHGHFNTWVNVVKLGMRPMSVYPSPHKHETLNTRSIILHS